jgi:hypothetical protein
VYDPILDKTIEKTRDGPTNNFKMVLEIFEFSFLFWMGYLGPMPKPGPIELDWANR